MARDGDILELEDHTFLKPQGDGFLLYQTRSNRPDGAATLEVHIGKKDARDIIALLSGDEPVAGDRKAVHAGGGWYDIYEDGRKINAKSVRKHQLDEFGV